MSTVTTLHDVPAYDTEYQDKMVESVTPEGDGWVITHSGGWQFYVPPGFVGTPQRGDRARFFGRGIGYRVRGLFINNSLVYYRTPDEEAAESARELAAMDKKRRDDFEAAEATLDADYAALPAVFRARIDRFRANNPDFRWESEAYEVFTCTQAVAFAAALGSVEALETFRALDYEAQRALVPAMSDQHSGNTFGTACRLAHWYLTQPENVTRDHGALCPLVGCIDYGCAPKPEGN